MMHVKVGPDGGESRERIRCGRRRGFCSGLDRSMRRSWRQIIRLIKEQGPEKGRPKPTRRPARRAGSAFAQGPAEAKKITAETPQGFKSLARRWGALKLSISNFKRGPARPRSRHQHRRQNSGDLQLGG